MDVQCPYCSDTVDIAHLERHVRLLDGDGHGRHGAVPVEGFDNPWALRLDASDAPDGETDGPVPEVEYVVDGARRGLCPACEMGALGLAGGDGWFSRGRRRLVCPHCGWESPEWLSIEE